MVFPILINTYQGVKDVDRNLQEVARSFCSSEAQLWRHLIIPSALPFIVVGIRLAIGRGLVGMIVAEFYTSITGLGYMIVRYANAFETDKLFVPIVVVMVLGVGLMTWSDVDRARTLILGNKLTENNFRVAIQPGMPANAAFELRAHPGAWQDLVISRFESQCLHHSVNQFLMNDELALRSSNQLV